MPTFKDTGSDLALKSNLASYCIKGATTHSILNTEQPGEG
jgi:hypothetical protein